MMRQGRIWLFGDDIDTDVLAPGRYMRGSIEQLATHCLEAVNPRFAAEARPGDVLVAGLNFGAGSSREQAAEALKSLGIAAVIARSFAGIFYRNAINLGLPVLVGEANLIVNSGEPATLNVETGILDLPEQQKKITCEPLPPFLLAMIRDGGLVPHLEKRFAAEREAP
jgi:3-isopropylmalate/(R)-2-methylmalate dehydratase small subunit